MASGYSQGLYSFTLDGNTGGLVGEVAKRGEAEGDKATNLTFTAFDKERSNLYGVHEVSEFGGTANTGAVSRWAVDPKSGAMEKKEVGSA